MTVLVWTIAPLAVVAALVLLLSHLRRLEDESVALTDEVRRLGELRPHMAEVRREMERTAPLVDGLWGHRSGT